MHPSSEQVTHYESSVQLQHTDRNMDSVVNRQNMKQAHDVTFLKENSPAMPRRYESEEEEISEAETNGHGRMYSPVDGDSDMSAFDSELSADEQASDTVQTRRTNNNRRSVLSPYLSSGRKSRPVSMETVKRSSTATFVPGSSGHDEDEVVSSATPLTTSPMPSPFLRAAAVVVPADASEPEIDLYHQAGNRDSMSSVEDADSSLLVATPVIYMTPSTKPNLISIAPSSNRTTPTKQDNPARLRRGLSKSSRRSSSVRSSTRLARRASQKRYSSLSLASTLSTEHCTAPSAPSQKQAKRVSSGSPSISGAAPVHGRRHSRTRSRSRNRETALIESPTLGFLSGEPNLGGETSATITNFSDMPPMPHPLTPRSMSFSFHAPLTFSPERQSIDISPQSQRPVSSLGPLGPRKISSFNTVDTDVRQGQRSFSSESRKSFRPSLSHNPFLKKGPRRNPRSISMSFRRVESPEPSITASPTSSRSSPHQRSVSTFDGGIGVTRPSATYPYVKSSSVLYTPLGTRSSSTMDLESFMDPIADSSYDADSGPSSSKEKSQKRTRDNDTRTAGKSFMGIRLGRKKRIPTLTEHNMI
ncbi:hypothetical protein AOR_1_680134 [Paecilomyces variotii No. 5]|uniref:Uncharacterized protein n=1 Tax=Byssochlamys spectabilis (strain No. 5 / NBRC 109023) TaxID=1356009 RepID=V5FR05_BYSSN|nr:hypothetical protein AOR_1_680134 [Paecilomyces variotii No. 5]